TLSVVSMLLLELKFALENLTKRMPPGEILTFAKFMLLTAVILPVLPNQGFGRFAINPFKTWLVVVAVSAVSYGSYVIQKVTRDQGGLILTAILSGAYSSTVATVVLAKRSKTECRPHLFSGATLVASGMMYLRLAILVGLFNRGLLLRLGPPFLVLAVLAGLTGWFWSRMPEAPDQEEKQKYLPANPLEMRAAVLFALFFIAILVVTHLAITYLGRSVVFSLASIMAVTDVDP
ncbi:MAG: MgtC/SapB family protein, partial [Blastocatellia bacterium]